MCVQPINETKRLINESKMTGWLRNYLDGFVDCSLKWGKERSLLWRYIKIQSCVFIDFIPEWWNSLARTWLAWGIERPLHRQIGSGHLLSGGRKVRQQLLFIKGIHLWKWHHRHKGKVDTSCRLGDWEEWPLLRRDTGRERAPRYSGVSW